MTWWDHETGSIWTQPWGRALEGELKGTQLQLLPFSLEPWESWREAYPDTLVLDIRDRSYGQQTASDNFVAGVAFGQDIARGYPYAIIARQMVTNDTLNGIPLVIHVNPETRSIHIFVRQLSDGTELTFMGGPEQMFDLETDSTWDPVRGIAIDGELAGEGLREIPYISSFDWAWLDFYPNTDFYGPPES